VAAAAASGAHGWDVKIAVAAFATPLLAKEAEEEERCCSSNMRRGSVVHYHLVFMDRPGSGSASLSSSFETPTRAPPT
jgi:hypothetical protein